MTIEKLIEFANFEAQSRLGLEYRYLMIHLALGIFSLFFDDNLVGMIVEETNRYAEQCLQEINKQWTTNAEIWAYIGFMILMGINRLPEIQDYWSTDTSLRYAPTADRISRDRFEEITQYLHFADNDKLPARGEDGFLRLQKVDPIICGRI